MKIKWKILSLAMLFILFAVEANADDPKPIYAVLSGTVTNSNGYPISNVRLKCVPFEVFFFGEPGEIYNPLTPVVVSTDASGYWEYSFPRVGNYEIFVYSSLPTFEPNQRCIPTSYGDQSNWPAERGILMVGGQSEFPNLDFLIHPRVSGGVYDRTDIPNSPYKTSAAGTIVFVGNRVVDTIDVGEPGYSFYPDECGVPYSGSISFFKPFHYFFNPSNDGLPEYDCSYTKAAYASHTKGVYWEEDAAVRKSWVGEGDAMLGYQYFPLTPDARVANNPNIWVEMDFNFSRNVTIPRDYLYIQSDAFSEDPLFKVYPDEDLTPENGHVAHFETPVTTCGAGDVRFWTKTIVKYGDDVLKWIPLGTGEPWRTSTSNMDLLPDDQLTVSDVVELARCFGLCPDDEAYSSNECECANFFPDEGDCIGLSEITLFSTVFYMGATKAEYSNPADVAIVWENCVNGDWEGCSQINFQSEVGWDVVLVEFGADDVENLDVNWLPEETYASRSALVPIPNRHNTWGLWIVGPSNGGTEIVGRLVQAKKNAPSQLQLKGVYSFGEGGNRGLSLEGEFPEIDKATGAYPNPFNSQTTISFFLREPRVATLEIFSVDGKKVKFLQAGLFPSGKSEISWAGDDDNARPVASGGYFYRLSDDLGPILQGKMTLLK